MCYGSPASPEDPEHLTFKVPGRAEYRLRGETGPSAWIKAVPTDGSTNEVEIGSRVVVQLRDPGQAGARRILNAAGAKLRVAREVSDRILVFEAGDARQAAYAAHRFAQLPEVVAACPVIRKQAELHGPYAPEPKDTWFFTQWALENRDWDAPDGIPWRAGPDLNVRAAWPWSTGEGVTIAVADVGVEMDHPELSARVSGAPHWNFANRTANAGPIARGGNGAHGTEAAGLAAASLNNGRMAGVAPLASVASWVIFATNTVLVSDEDLMEMYQYASNAVSVQSHSWGHPGLRLNAPTVLEEVGISNAITFGRNGLGVVMVRSAGNDRGSGASAADDGYSNDPRVITVAAVRPDGRVGSYSEPGACVLVAAPSGDPPGFDGLLSTDLLGTDGVNQLGFLPPNEDLSGYVFFSMGFSGTSASTPQIAGLAALVLGANPGLTWRDVRQVLALSARHFDFADPDLVSNGAGLLVSHNDGFGVPDAGEAVRLARTWTNRPAARRVVLNSDEVKPIPDDGLRLEVSGAGVPPELSSVRCLPSVGPHADTPTPALPLADFGYGTNAAGFDLTDKGALIQRGGTTYANSISLAARQGARFAVVYNYPGDPPGGDQLLPMGGTDFVPIPAVFIGNTDGVRLRELFRTNSTARARIRLQGISRTFEVADTLICEDVGLAVRTDHPLRGDLRITLVSPSGTRSVLQKYNGDTQPGPIDWTYYSTHHLLESTAGSWTAWVSDEGEGNSGAVLGLALVLHGVDIADSDQDGLADAWELQHFTSLTAQSASGDPDGDGYPNSREQLMGSDPGALNQDPLQIDLSRLNPWVARLSWASPPGYEYEISSTSDLQSWSVVTNVPGLFPETEWLASSGSASRFFRVRRIPAGPGR